MSLWIDIEKSVLEKKQEKAINEARERYEEDWGFAHGIGPYGSAVFDSFDPWSD